MRYIFCFLTYLFSFNTIAGEPLADLLALLQPVNGLTAQFEQISLDKGNKELQRQAGQLSVKKTGEFFWAVSSPFEQEIICDGKSVYVVDPDLEQVTIKKLDKGSRMIPLLLFSGDSREVLKHYRVTSMPASEKNQASFSLQPLQTDSLFSELLIRFDEGTPRQLDIRDSLGQSTRVLFSDVQVNKAIPADRFRFIPAPDLDVIDER